jgi:crotonobetainyl-CoA:carnitine CoA-transferase CaiB-like acyl-CoA transferase
VLDIFEEHQVAISQILNIDDIMSNEQYLARRAVVRIDDEEAGPIAMPGVVPRFSRTPGSVRHAGRRLGADTADVVSDWLSDRPPPRT